MDFQSPIDPTKRPDAVGSNSSAPKSLTGQSKFEAQMQGGVAKQTGPSAPTPAELTRGAAVQGQPSIDSLVAQASVAQEGYGTVRQKLNTDNLTLRSSQQRLLGNKLSDAATHLQAANSKLGGEPAESSQRAAGGGPIARFLNMVGDGENQLKAVQEQLMKISKSGGEIRPADMLLAQIKMGQAQQEIEYSSVLLSKVIDAIKTTLNTPL